MVKTNAPPFNGYTPRNQVCSQSGVAWARVGSPEPFLDSIGETGGTWGRFIDTFSWR
jgi:hypothetical protein